MQIKDPWPAGGEIPFRSILEGNMPTGTFIVVIGFTAVFVVFIAALAWVDRWSNAKH